MHSRRSQERVEKNGSPIGLRMLKIWLLQVDRQNQAKNQQTGVCKAILGVNSEDRMCAQQIWMCTQQNWVCTQNWLCKLEFIFNLTSKRQLKIWLKLQEVVGGATGLGGDGAQHKSCWEKSSLQLLCWSRWWAAIEAAATGPGRWRVEIWSGASRRRLVGRTGSGSERKLTGEMFSPTLQLEPTAGSDCSNGCGGLKEEDGVGDEDWCFLMGQFQDLIDRFCKDESQ